MFIVTDLILKSGVSVLPPETEERNRKLTVLAMYLFFCILWTYFVVTGRMGTNRGLQQAKFEE